MNKYFKVIGTIVAISLLLSLTSCSFGVSQESLDALESKLEKLESKIEDLEDDIKTLEDEKEDAPAESPSQEKQAQATETPEAKADPSVFSEAAVLNLLEITEYTYASSYSNHVFLGIKNNSEFDITIYAEMIFKNDEGNLVGTSNDEERAFEAGQEIMLDFSSDEDYASYEYSLSVDVETYYVSVLSLLTKEISVTDSKVIIAITNTGEKPAEFVEYTVLFLNGNTVVDYDWGYCIDDDSEIKPGKTNYDEAKTYENFDSVLVFLTGRASK